MLHGFQCDGRLVDAVAWLPIKNGSCSSVQPSPMGARPPSLAYLNFHTLSPRFWVPLDFVQALWLLQRNFNLWNHWTLGGSLRGCETTSPVMSFVLRSPVRAAPLLCLIASIDSVIRISSSRVVVFLVSTSTRSFGWYLTSEKMDSILLSHAQDVQGHRLAPYKDNSVTSCIMTAFLTLKTRTQSHVLTLTHAATLFYALFIPLLPQYAR